MAEAGDALQEEITQATGEFTAAVARGSEELLGEEGVALRAGDDPVHHGRRQGSAGTGREQRGQLVPPERAELEHERRAGAPDPLRQPPHPPGRSGLVGPVGRKQQNRSVADVMREEDDQIEGRGIGPVQILQHKQHGRGSGGPSEQRQRRLEHPQLRASRLPAGPPRLPERAQRLRER